MRPGVRWVHVPGLAARATRQALDEPLVQWISNRLTWLVKALGSDSKDLLHVFDGTAYSCLLSIATCKKVETGVPYLPWTLLR